MPESSDVCPAAFSSASNALSLRSVALSSAATLRDGAKGQPLSDQISVDSCPNQVGGPTDNVGEIFEMGLRPKDKPADLWLASDRAVRRKLIPLGQHY
jgi:hypothetical protein